MRVPSGFLGIYIDPNEMRYDGPAYPGAEWGELKHQFRSRTTADLHTLNATALGRDLLELIAKRHQGIGTNQSGVHRTVEILFRPPSGPNGSSGAGTGAMSVQDKNITEKNFGGRQFSFAGRGSRSKIRMHNGPESEAIYTELAGVQTPTWIVLAHELIHALHHLSGTTKTRTVAHPQADINGVKEEELWTTGLAPYENTRLSENAIRREVNLPPRTHYYFEGDTTVFEPTPVHGINHRPGYWYCACLQEQDH